MKSLKITGIGSSRLIRQRSRDTLPVVRRRNSFGAGFRSRPKWTFEQFAIQARFDDILRVLQDFQKDPDRLRSWLGEGCQGKDTPLHVILRYHPPPRLIDALVHALKNIGWFRSDSFIPEDVPDNHGRTPLHVATAAGSHIHVVERLLEGDTFVMPAYTRDNFGRFPLHWACMNPSGQSNPFFSPHQHMPYTAAQARNLRYNMIRMVRLLVDVYPEAASLADNKGMTPLDYAIQNNADAAIIQFLQMAIKSFQKKANKNDTTEVETQESSVLEFSNNGFGQNDDMSSLGWEDDETTYEYERDETSYSGKASHQPSYLIFDPADKESPEIIEKYWFL